MARHRTYCQLLTEILVGTGIVAAPVSYAVNGVQYVAVAAGWNGVRIAPDDAASPTPYDTAGRLLVLKLDGGPVRVADRKALPAFLAIDTPQTLDRVDAGARLYHTHCSVCHGVSGESGVYPDLRRMSQGSHDSFDAIVRGGLLQTGGMASFADVLSADDTASVRSYVVVWAHRSRREGPEAAPVAQRATDGTHRRLGL